MRLNCYKTDKQINEKIILSLLPVGTLDDDKGVSRSCAKGLSAVERILSVAFLEVSVCSFSMPFLHKLPSQMTSKHRLSGSREITLPLFRSLVSSFFKLTNFSFSVAL